MTRGMDYGKKFPCNFAKKVGLGQNENLQQPLNPLGTPNKGSEKVMLGRFGNPSMITETPQQNSFAAAVCALNASRAIIGSCASTKGRWRFFPLSLVFLRLCSIPVSHPAKLSEIIELFEFLPDEEKRENLVAYADLAKNQAPREGESFDLEDVRKDEECTDTVGVYLRVDPSGGAHFRISLGPEVQTLTRAMSAILCKGLDGVSPAVILEVESDFVEKIVGGQLVRIRSQTVYYILTRLKSACKVYLNRKRHAETTSTA